MHGHSRSTAVIAGNAKHFPLWLTQSNARYLCGHVVTSSVSLISVQARKITHFTAPPSPKKSDDFSGTLFPVQRHSSIPVFPAEKKILCPCTSVLDLFSLDFWINEKAATPHYERQEYFLLLRFAMLCNGFGIQNHAAIRQPKRDSIHSAAVSLVHRLTVYSSIYVLIKFSIFKITSCVS